MNRFRLALAVASLAGVFASTWSPDASAAILQRPRSVAAFYTPDDGDMHAIVAQTDGSIREVYFVEGSFVSSAVIASFPGVVALTAYYTPIDGYRHAIVALANGQIWEVYYQPKYGIFQDLLTTLAPTSFGTPYAIAGWVTPDTTQNLVIGTSGNFQNGLHHFTFYTHPFTLEASQFGQDVGDLAAWSSTNSSGTTNYLAMRSTNGGTEPFPSSIITLSWPTTGSFLETNGSLSTPSGSGASILAMGGLADPGLKDPAELLYIDSTANLHDDLTLLSGGSSLVPVAAPLTGPGISLGAAMESNGRRHAIVAVGSELYDYRATGTGSWESYFLGTF
jgi:hypothetical protein